MNVHFLVSELAKWDALEVGGSASGSGPGAIDALVLSFFADERPLRGAAGLCDWRLCGRLSRLLLGERVRGSFGEMTLYPAGGGQLPFRRLVLFGLGDAAGFDEGKAQKAAATILETMHRLDVRSYALVPPGRSTGGLSARRALELFLAEADKRASDVVELTIIESLSGQKEAAELARTH